MDFGDWVYVEVYVVLMLVFKKPNKQQKKPKKKEPVACN